MSISDLCTTYINTAKLKDETEKNIIDFAEAPWGLGMGYSPDIPPLYPVQKFIFKCYYNIPLDDKEKRIIVNDKFNEKLRFKLTEMEYLHFLYEEGRINVKDITGVAVDTRPNLVLVIGRRGTKTSAISIIVAFETYKLLRKICPQKYYKMMPDDEIRISCIATNQEQASELFRRITGHLEDSDYFKKYRNKPTLNYMQLSTQRDIDKYGLGQRPSIRVVASPCSGRGLRGRNNIIAILDEMAYFFESESSQDRSDKTVYEAVTPSCAKFNSPEGYSHGRIISISSPAARKGKFFELYQRSWEKDCDDILMIKAPSWEVDYTLSPKYLRAKYAENPLSYDAEFGANFSDKISAWIENEQVLRMNIIPGLRVKERSYERLPHFMGIDIGLKGDGTAIAIGHIVHQKTANGPRDLIELDAIDVRYAADEGKDFFRPEEMADWIASYMDKFLIVKGLMDQYYGLSIVPLLQDKGIKQIEAVHVSRDFSSKVYQNFMSRMLNASLRIPEDNERIVNGRKTKDLPLVEELLSLQATVHSKFLITVKAPEIKGMHDDMSDAYSRLIWLANDYISSGGSGISKNNIITSNKKKGSSYLRHYRKQKKAIAYTKRPTSSMIRGAQAVRTNNIPARLGR